MGLDWTAALLPTERPSWSSNNLRAASPPSAYGLPPSSTSYIRHPRDNKLRLERKATWRWEESEWKVLINMTADAAHGSVLGLQRVAKPLIGNATDEIKAGKTASKANEIKDGGLDVKARLKEKQGEEDMTDNDDEDHKEAGADHDAEINEYT